MKLIGISVIMGMALIANAQSDVTDDSTKATIARVAHENTFEAQPATVSEIVVNGISYSGIFVQLYAAPQPLQLINPLAPTSYGNGEQNLIEDPITKRPVGLKFFSIGF